MENPIARGAGTRVAPGAALAEHYARMRIPAGQEFPIKPPQCSVSSQMTGHESAQCLP